MIATIQELISDLRSAELTILEEDRGITHRPTIGDMYEGLSKRLLEEAVFDGLGMSVKDGFIRYSDGELSDQLDIMIVIGDGEQVPHTNHWIYPIEQVVAVFQIKKTLYSDGLRESHHNLLSAVREPAIQKLNWYWIEKCFVSISGRTLPEDLSKLPVNLQQLCNVMVADIHRPLRVVLGHFGFQSEYSLREAFVKFIGKNMSDPPHREISGFSPSSFPDLILCRDFGLIKQHGLPYAGKIDENGWWPFYGSFSEQSILFLLECLWTKLTLWFALPEELWGDGLQLETTTQFMYTRIGSKRGHTGWEMMAPRISRADLPSTMLKRTWQPVKITEHQASLFFALGQTDGLKISDPIVGELAGRAGLETVDFIDSIVNTGLVYQSEDGLLVYNTISCGVVTMPDGCFYAEDMEDIRFKKWIIEKSTTTRPVSD